MGAAASLILLHTKHRLIDWQRPHLRHLLQSWKDIVRLGIPAALTQALNPVAQGFYIRLAAGVGGVQAVAAMATGTRIESIVFMISMSYSLAIVPFVGHKILSLYESDIHVIVRGKAGAAVEFGNSLFVAETASGFLLDHELRREASPGDAKWLQERYALVKESSAGQLCGVIGDRGFDSAGARKKLATEDAFNGLCPRNVGEMEKRQSEDEVFVGAQKRRAQTEGRIGILKNIFLQGTPRAKGFTNRQLQVDWAVRQIIPQEVTRQTLANLDNDIREGVFRPETPDWSWIWQRANLLARLHTPILLCRTLDILHGAAAEISTVDEVVTGDLRQFRLCQAVGLTVTAIPSRD